MRIFLTGASGLLGINFALTAASNHNVLGVYHQQPIINDDFQAQRLDLFDTRQLHETLTQWQPDWIVHCAALADINQCERNPEMAARLNIDLPKQLAELAVRYKAKFLAISTDCVFDGKKEGYCENDIPRPLNVYGKTKLAGEEAVLRACSSALIARVNFYGWSLTGTRSLAEWVINQLLAGKNITGFTDIIFSPLLANSLATILLQMMSANLSGVYHVVNSDKLNKYDFAVHLARQFQLDETLIQPGSINDVHSNIDRPLNMVLSNEKLRCALSQSISCLTDDIKLFHQLKLAGYSAKLQAIRKQNGN